MHGQDPPQGQLLSRTQKGHFEEKNSRSYGSHAAVFPKSKIMIKIMVSKQSGSEGSTMVFNVDFLQLRKSRFGAEE